ncbi:hypothetical protein HDU79_002484, partial [Rhizoclosmatium sp. JEL0117]
MDERHQIQLPYTFRILSAKSIEKHKALLEKMFPQVKNVTLPDNIPITPESDVGLQLIAFLLKPVIAEVIPNYIRDPVSDADLMQILLHLAARVEVGENSWKYTPDDKVSTCIWRALAALGLLSAGVSEMDDDEFSPVEGHFAYSPSLMDVLPPRVLEGVFLLLPFETRVLCARGVCVSWGALYGLASLWTSLVLPKYAVVLPYLPHGCVASVTIRATEATSAARADAANACRLLNKYGQHRIRSISLEGHGIDTAIMEFLARIISPSLTHIQFSLVALSFDRPKFLTVLQRAENITSLHITRRPFRRATILSPLLSLLSNSLTHLRLDNLAAEQIPIIGSIVPNLVQLQLDGLIELTACDWGAMLMNQAQDDLMLPGVMGGAVDILDDPSAQHLQKTLMASTSSIPLSNPTTPIFYLLPSLKYLSCTNVERESDEAVTSFMTVLVAKTPLLESLVFSCPHYMMDLWPCQEFWANIRYLSIDHCIIT